MPEKITNLSDQGVGAYPLERPLRLLHDCGEGLYGVEELDVQALHLTRDVLRHYLEAVEASRLLKFNFRASKLGFLMAIKIVY